MVRVVVSAMAVAVLAAAAAATPPPVLNAGSQQYAGYSTQGSPATYVAGTFNVPLRAAGPIAVWVGIGEGGTGGFAQAGIEVLRSGAGYHVSPWTFSINPANKMTWGPWPSLAIAPGNTVTVTMTLVSPPQRPTALWTVTFKDDSTGGHWTGTLIAAAGNRQQVEWIVESPGTIWARCGHSQNRYIGQCPLGRFTPVSFTKMAEKGHIDSWVRLVLSQDRRTVAAPSLTSTPLAGFQVSPPT